MSEHSKLPWRVDSMDPAFVSVPVNDGHDDNPIVECYNADDGEGEISRGVAIANADFIVRACNAHEALIEALELAISYAVEHNAEHGGNKEIEADISVIEQALTLARGEQVKP